MIQDNNSWLKLSMSIPKKNNHMLAPCLFPVCHRLVSKLRHWTRCNFFHTCYPCCIISTTKIPSVRKITEKNNSSFIRQFWIQLQNLALIWRKAFSLLAKYSCSKITTINVKESFPTSCNRICLKFWQDMQQTWFVSFLSYDIVMSTIDTICQHFQRYTCILLDQEKCI